MTIAEVVEIKTSLKDSQKDDEGNVLPVGSIQCRIGGRESNIGQVRNIWARPYSFFRRLPLIGEMVILFTGPTNDWSSTTNKGVGFYYINPINATDNVTLNTFPKIWKRKGLASSAGGAGERLSDKEEVGYTFDKKPRKVDFLQIYEGDDLMEGRLGQSIRFGSSIVGNTGVYSKKPTWKSAKNGDPLIIMRVNSKSGAGNKYTVEDLKEDDASIYIASKQSLSSLKAGFDKNTDAKQIGNWSAGSQVVVDADRLILNAKKDMLFLIGAKQTTITGKKILLQTDKYKIDVDDLMDFLKKWLGYQTDLATAKAVYSTASGPTALASNSAQFIQLQSTDFMKFKQP